MRPAGCAPGFTMIELLITITILAVVMVIMGTVLFATTGSKTATTNRLESVQAARVAVDMIARDLRSAGHGADITWTTPQPAIAYVDSQEVILSGNFQPYPDSVGIGPHGTPVAYDPDGSPDPYPLVGTAWTPVRKYRTGAELVRWTLDLNNDGTVDTNDRSGGTGPEAASSRNPDDYVLVRQVYGDSTGGVAGDNGGTMENVALVLSPGGANPPMFLVYLRGSTIPWNWTDGPIPSASLPNIERVEVQVTAASSKPDKRGRYATTTLSAQVNSMRNTPDFGAPQYSIEGYVFDDTGMNNGIMDTGEPGLPGVNVRVGDSYTGTTHVDGHYLIRVPAGTYSVRHTVPVGYGVYTDPDSFVVTVPPGTSRSFADVALPGGRLDLYAYIDADLNGSYDAGEPMRSSVKLTVTPGGDTGFTDVNGYIRLWAPVGGYSVTATAPDSFTVTSPNPVTGTVVSGDTLTHWFGLGAGLDSLEPGAIAGKVFVDADHDGILDGGEEGKEGVWVGVSPDSGVTVVGWGTTDANGNYSLTVPANDPPGTEPYYVYIVPPSGFYATSSASLGPVLLSEGATLANYDFGVSGFQIIRLAAQRVLSLGSGDLIEKDWPGGATGKRRGDADLVLGADAFGTDQISGWFNQYNAASLFNATRDYNRTASQAVLCLSVDTLDTGGTSFQGLRNDVVTGTKCAAPGNFFVWLNQNSSGNEGYLPTTPSLAYKTIDNGDVQALITADMSGPTSAPDPNDILVGTKSPITGQGTVELWESSGGSEPTYTRVDVYPDATYTMGEVTGIARGDIDGDGMPDLVVSTRTTEGTYTGEILVFKYLGKTASPRFKYVDKIVMHAHTPTCVGLTEVNGDGDLDIVCGSVSGVASGEVRYYRNDIPALLQFSHKRTVSAPGPVQCLSISDFGGASRADIAAGWRQDSGSYAGGISIYYTDTGTLPPTGVDPSGGLALHWCAALTVNHFNYGIFPDYSGLMLPDLAAGVKSSATDAAIWLFIR